MANAATSVAHFSMPGRRTRDWRRLADCNKERCSLDGVDRESGWVLLFVRRDGENAPPPPASDGTRSEWCSRSTSRPNSSSSEACGIVLWGCWLVQRPVDARLLAGGG